MTRLTKFLTPILGKTIVEIVYHEEFGFLGERLVFRFSDGSSFTLDAVACNDETGRFEVVE